jgi:hypothetical protein
MFLKADRMEHKLLRLMIVGSLSIVGCASQNQKAKAFLGSASQIEFGDSGEYGCADTIAVAKRAGFDYIAVLERCLERDPRALHQLFWLTKHAGFDAASSEGNATVLGKLLRHLGDEDFGRVLRKDPPEVQESVIDELKYDFGLDEGVSDAWMSEWYPITLGGMK